MHVGTSASNNLSDKPVTLKYGDYIAVIDFIKTSTFTEGKSLNYPGTLDVPSLPELILFEDYKPQNLKSALATRVVSQLRDFNHKLEKLTNNVEERMSAVQGRIDSFVSLTFAVVALLFAAVTLFFGKPNEPNWWDPTVFWVCALAIFISMLAWVNSRSSVQWFRRPWQRMTFEIILVVLVVAAIGGFSRRTLTKVKELEKQVQTLQQTLSRPIPQGSGTQPAGPKP